MKPSLKYSAHGTARVSIVEIPKYFGTRLVYLSWKSEYSWAIRDFITGEILRSGDSPLTFSEIEAEIGESEKPIYRSVDRESEWTTELIESSKRMFGSKYDGEKPSSMPGKWKRLQRTAA